MGVRSQTRAILKMTNCTFTYPGAKKPQLQGVSCETLCGALLSAIDQRFNDRFTVGMKNAKRKMIKATQKDTHPSSFT